MIARGIGQRIRAIRNALRITQMQLAHMLGLSTSSAISAYETGDALPPVDTLMKLAEIGNTSLDWIVTGGHMAAGPDGKIIQLTDKELKLLVQLRNATPELRELISKLIDAALVYGSSKNKTT